MRAILIDPWASAVTEVEIADDSAAIYAALSAPAHTVDTFTVIDLGQRQTLYLDDNGLLSAGVPLWRLDGFPDPLAGKGLVLGTDSEGDTVAARISLSAMAALVSWTDAETSGDLTPTYTATRHVKGGGDTLESMFPVTIVGGRVIPQPRKGET